METGLAKRRWLINTVILKSIYIKYIYRLFIIIALMLKYYGQITNNLGERYLQNLETI